MKLTRAVAIFLASLSLASCLGQESGLTTIHKVFPAVDGVLDLTDVDMRTDRTVSLAGYWQFTYGRHILPGDVTDAADISDAGEDPWGDADLIRVPATWKGHVYGGNPLPGSGIATYRLRIITAGESPGTLALMIPAWETAYRLFVNGREVTTAGIAGTDAAGTIPVWQPRIVLFETADGYQDLVLQISNFSHARGGPIMTPYIGTVDAVQMTREMGIGRTFFSFGGLLMISFYHGAIFLLRRKEKSALYFSLFCLAMAVRSLVINEQILVLLFPSIPWSMHVRITYLTLALAVSLFTHFIQSLYGDDVNVLLTRILASAGYLYAAVIILTAPAFFTNLITPFQGLIVATGVYGTIVLTVAARRKREGAVFFLAAFILFFLCVINDILYHHNLITTVYIVPTGFLLFVFLQAVVLAKRYAAVFVRMEALFQEKTKLEGTAVTLQNLSYLDALTGVPNRRRLDEYLGQEWKRATREGNAVSCIMIDIDFFKRYNDVYGHPAGDEVLKAVAATIRSCVHRPADLVARYGGEEFAVLLPGTDIEGAAALAEKIRKSVSNLGIAAADQTASDTLTVSLGCSSMIPRDGDDPLDLVKHADTALYSAKMTGRNRVVH